VHTLNEQEWQRLEQAAVLANVRQAFDGSDVEEGVASLPRQDYVPPHITNDAHTLALMLQDQLEAINAEIGYATCSMFAKHTEQWEMWLDCAVYTHICTVHVLRMLWCYYTAL